MRAFIALALPEEVREALGRLQQDLAASRADVKWVEPHHLHVTMKFLGEITEEQRHAVEAMLRRLAEREAPFLLGVQALGAFPSADAPRVLWVGLADGRERVQRMAEAIEREGAALSFVREDRPFAAHVTIGRVRSTSHRQQLARALLETTWQPPAPWRVTSLTLYQSVLGSGGPRYTVLADVPLARGVSGG